jgi:hypothetical protein
MQYLVESGIFQIGLLFAFLIPAILFLLTQQNTLKAIKPENRLMQPGLVWLQCIPVFGQLWQFFVVSRIANSIRKEITFRQEDSILGFSDAAAVEEIDKRPTFQIGIAYCVLFTINLTMKYVWVLLYLSRLQGLVALSMMTCWIIYWVRLASWKRKLKRVADLGFF